MRKTLPILFFLLQCCIVSLWSQGNYPIYVTTSLLPPYSLNLSDYSAQGSQRLMVTIVVKDLDVTNLPVKLRIRMETAGVTIETSPTINTIPIYLDGGSATVLFGEDFTDYFNINNLQFKGYSKDAYRRSGLLPEGFYRFSVEVLHFQTNRVISNTSTATAWMAVGKPPVLRSPANGAELGHFVGMPISFSWLASNVGSPVSAGSVRYKFEMWEVRVQGVNPYNVVASMPAIHEYVTNATLYAFNPASIMMEEGMTYAWRVTAFDESGRMPFEQNGQSEVRTFVYKSKCDKINQIQTTTSGQKGTFLWVPAQNHTSYNVEVRNKANDWFLSSQTFDSKVEFYNLEAGHTYEMRTQSVCNGDPNNTSDFSDWVQLVMPELKPAIINDDCPDCACDDDIPKVEITNFELRTNLASGDTLSNKSGTTRFIIKNVEQQGSDTFRGVFYFWSELWKIKIPCDFWDLQVNTDNVIVSMEYKSINNPAFLLDLDALSSTVNELLDYGAVIFSDAQITDTIQVVANFDNIHVRDGQLIAITLNPDGTVEETPLYITVEEAMKCLITNSNGDELVITSRGEVMGVKEYQQTGGGNNRLMNNYKKEKEANSLSTSAMVNFVAHPLQSFGFDKYTEQKQAIQHYYPALHNGYRPAFKSVGSFRTDRVGVDITEGLHFRDEMGIPSVLVDGGMSVHGAYHGSERALYAYRPTADGEEEIVGKLNVVSFDEEPRRVHIISVNNARLPSVSELEARLNSIYRQAVCTWTVIAQDPVTLTFPGGKMTHGGSGTASTYNSDQRAIAKAFESSGRQMEPGSLYLFFVEDVTFKDRSLAGYMPLQRQVGFIYGNPTLEVVAHELAHGAFMMRHTFSPKAYIIGEGQTQNLMDYAGGTELWKHQWDLIHNPEKILFSWAQDEEEGAFRSADWTYIVERIRCARYNGDASIDISVLAAQLRQSTLTWNYPNLLDNNFYGNIVLTMDYADLKTIDVNKITVQHDKISIGEKWKQIHFQIINCHRNNSSVVEEAHQLFNYLVVDKSEYELQIENLCKRMDEMNDIGVQIKRLPSCFFKTLSIERRADYIEKLAKDCEVNLSYIFPIINSIPERGQYVLDLFSMLNSKPNISRALFDKSLWSNNDRYKNLIQTFTLLFYRTIVKEEIKDKVESNYLFRWYREPKSFNIYYSTALNSNNDIAFDAKIEYYIDNKNNREVVEYERDIVMPIFDIVGVDFKTKVDFIGVEGAIFPMPAFYFNWMNQEYNRIQRNQAIDVTIYTASFIFVVGELRAAQSVWKIAVGLAGLAHSSGELYFKLNDDVVKWLEMNPRGERFLFAWDAIGYILAGLEIRSELLEAKLPYFASVVLAWEEFSFEEKLVLKDLMSEDEYNHLMAIINTFN